MIVTALVCLTLSGCEQAKIYVYDGDTFTVAGERIRLLSIDAPEIKGACAAEKTIARMARNELQRLLNHKTVRIARTGTDRYGRTLATVTANDVDVSKAILAKGLARAWTQKYNHHPEPWCL